ISATANCIGAAGDPSKCQAGGGQDDNGHGSHVSGISAASTGNGKGIAGVAPDARLVVAKALDSDGSGSTDDINAGIEWVVGDGAADADHEILSTLWSSTAKNVYGVEQGTSMATPHVTGALADLVALGYSPNDAVQRLLSTANTSVACGSKCRGRLDVAKAVGPPAGGSTS